MKLLQGHQSGLDLRLLGRHVVVLFVTSSQEIQETGSVVQSCGEAEFQHMEIFLHFNGGGLSLVGHPDLREEGAPAGNMQGRLD